MPEPKLTPRLIVAGADRAISFYQEVFGAQLLERFVDAGRVVHAAMRIDDAVFALAEERHDWNNVSPASLEGSAVILQINTDDADALAEAMLRAGAKEVFPVADQFYGKREGRFRDPFGHLWIVSQTLEALSAQEIERRVREP